MQAVLACSLAVAMTLVAAEHQPGLVRVDVHEPTQIAVPGPVSIIGPMTSQLRDELRKALANPNNRPRFEAIDDARYGLFGPSDLPSHTGEFRSRWEKADWTRHSVDGRS